jgi:hypothetical protein
MADEMINSTKPHNKSSGTQGIGDSVKAMDEWDMNVLNDPITKSTTGKYNKNS